MATAGSDAGGWLLFQDNYAVTALNPQDKPKAPGEKEKKPKFEKVTRLQCQGETYETSLLIDTACEVFPVREGDKLSFALASTLRLDGKPDDGTYDQSGKRTHLDSYDYGMCGRVFKVEYQEGKKVSIVASFGGLLMLLKGDQRHLSSIEMGMRIYALLRKVA